VSPPDVVGGGKDERGANPAISYRENRNIGDYPRMTIFSPKWHEERKRRGG